MICHIYVCKQSQLNISFALLFQSTSVLDNLEFPANFERCTQPKTIANVMDWMNVTAQQASMLYSDYNQVSADGAGNAVGSILEFEAQSREVRSNDIGVDVCIAHQNERAGGYASGVLSFAEPVNEELGDILAKSHSIQVRFNRAPNRMDVLKEVQEKYNREPKLSPKPGNETRWNSWHVEAERANVIMGDLCMANSWLLGEDGDDYVLVGKITDGIDTLVYDEYDKMVLRQFEAAALEAKLLSKFSQEKSSTYAYLLLEVKIVLQRCTSSKFEMHQGLL